MNTGAENPKVAKKLAKAAAKAAKKQSGAPAATAVQTADGKSPAERSAVAAERQVALQRWRVALAIIAAVIAAATLLAVWAHG